MIGKPVTREGGGVLSFINEAVQLHSSRDRERADVLRKWNSREGRRAQGSSKADERLAVAGVEERVHPASKQSQERVVWEL